MENAYRQWYYELNAQRFGPVSWDALRELAWRGVINAHSKVFTDGWSGWVPAAQVPGLTVAPMPAQQDPAMQFLLPVNRAPLAIVAGYLGLFSMLGIFAPFAVITGIFALRSLKQHPELTGAGRAWFGIVMGGLFSILYGLAMLS